MTSGRADGREARTEALLAAVEHEHHIDTLREVARIATERADQLSELRAPAAPVVAVPGNEAGEGRIRARHPEQVLQGPALSVRERMGAAPVVGEREPTFGPREAGHAVWAVVEPAPAVPVGVPGEVVRLDANESHSTTSGPVGVQPEPAEERSACGDNVCTNLGCTDACGLAGPVVHPEPADRAECASCRQPISMVWMHDGGEQPIQDGGHHAIPAGGPVAAAVAAVRADTAAMVEVEARKWLGRGVLATGQAEAFLRIANRITEDRS